jgi:hypothetical protein
MVTWQLGTKLRTLKLLTLNNCHALDSLPGWVLKLMEPGSVCTVQGVKHLL